MMTSSDIDLTHMSALSTGFALRVSVIGLVSQPVFCHLVPDGLGRAFLSVFLAVLHGAWHLVGFS